MKNFVRIICEKIVNVVFYLYFSYYKFVVTFWRSVKNICIALISFSRTYNNERSVWNVALGVPSETINVYWWNGEGAVPCKIVIMHKLLRSELCIFFNYF